MLHDFLGEYKSEILDLCRAKILSDGEDKPTSRLLDQGLPIFYDELIGVLRRTAGTAGTAGIEMDGGNSSKENSIKAGDAAAHGKESLRLGYTISQVVHSYGAVCQGIIEFVQTKSFKITPREFQGLNLSLDCAIAEAVTEFEKAQKENVSDGEIERLGFLIHEIGSSLTTATLAHEMIQKGSVGSSGVTSEALKRAHERMWHLIGGAKAEIAVRGHVAVEPVRLRLIDIVSEVESAAMIAGRLKAVDLVLQVDAAIQLRADRHLMFSALSNLVDNAIKFTKKHGKVSVRAREAGGRLLIDVEDECGGLPEGMNEELFTPFLQKGPDKTGMGLGLSLSRRAIELNQGKLTIRNVPAKGCIFTIDLPKNL